MKNIKKTDNNSNKKAGTCVSKTMAGDQFFNKLGDDAQSEKA